MVDVSKEKQYLLYGIVLSLLGEHNMEQEILDHYNLPETFSEVFNGLTPPENSPIGVMYRKIPRRWAKTCRYMESR